MVVVLAMSCTATVLLAGSVYALLLLVALAGLGPGAADAYAHYVTLPVSLWTLAAAIILAERSLPSAPLCTHVSAAANIEAQADLERDGHGAQPLTASPAPDRSSINACAGIGVVARDPFRQFLEIAPEQLACSRRALDLSPADKAPRPA